MDNTYKLQLKEEVKNANQDVIIFVNKRRGRRLKFPIDTPQEEYLKFKKLGFNIFRCSKCKSESCYGDCTEETIDKKIQDKYTTKEEKKEQELNKELEQQVKDIDELEEGIDSAAELNQPPIASEGKQIVKVDGEYTEIDESIDIGESNMELKQNIQKFELEKLTLKELRELYPDIKSVSKKGFIDQIPM